MKFTRPISRKSPRHDLRFKCRLCRKARASKSKPLPLSTKAHRAGKALATLLARIDNRNIDIFMLKYLIAWQTLGSARALACRSRRLAATDFVFRIDLGVFAHFKQEVREGEGVFASTRGACAPQNVMSEDLLALFRGRAAKFCEGGRKLPQQITVAAGRAGCSFAPDTGAATEASLTL